MAHRVGQKEESRARILESAGRGFRSQGYGGLGVDALAREAGVTSGAFYAHFKSKALAFRAAVTEGLASLRHRVESMRAENGGHWRERFIDFYLGDRRAVDLAGSCTLQSLTGEVARADDDARAAYETEFLKIIEVTAAGFESGSEAVRRAKAMAMLAILTGGVSMARAVKDPALANEIADAVRTVARGIE